MTLLDRYSRRINYLRISVTDRCNLRCTYCMPPGGVPLIPHEDVLTFEEIAGVVEAAVELGFHKVRLTGGEPLARRGIVDLVGIIAGLEGVRDFGITTNGTLLDRFAVPLKLAGLMRLNISLDTMDESRYRDITRGGELSKVIEGIGAAKSAGFTGTKINCVVLQSSDEPDARAVGEFARREGLEVRYIRVMNLMTGEFWVVEGGEGGKCAACNRLRLTSDGWIRPCLFGDKAVSVRELGAWEAIVRAVAIKPQSGKKCVLATFSKVGG